MTSPDTDEIDSEFQVLDDEYDQSEYYGGAFEGSHAYGDVIVFRLYSVVPGEDTDQLRIERRHHVAGRVVDHSRTEYELTDDCTVPATGQSLKTFCREHHYDSPRDEVASLLDSLDDRSDQQP